jgi:predicted TIM-barrel fold metal-dependent hydrolase
MKNNNYYLVKGLILAIFISLISLGEGVSQTNEEYYTAADFQKMDKIDAHCHINTTRSDFMVVAVANNFRVLAINTDAFKTVTVGKQQDIANFQRKTFPGHIVWLCAFTMEGWDDGDWQEKTLTYLKESFEKGAIGVKVWKNIGMAVKDKDGKFIMIDDPKFDLIFDYLEEKGIPLCGHLGEPKNCWLPLEEMTVNNDREYFKKHPEYHMYLHPEYPSYEEQIAARDRMLEKHPNLKFMGAHLGSMEWSVDRMAEHFDKFPNMTVDMAERISHLQVQIQKDREKVRDFFIKYQDRLIYGTDRGDRGEKDTKIFTGRAKEEWRNDWKFFTTDEPVSSWMIDGEVKGLKLPREVIEKIYYKNAEKLFPEFKKPKGLK